MKRFSKEKLDVLSRNRILTNKYINISETYKFNQEVKRFCQEVEV